jgi:hypothetical protein
MTDEYTAGMWIDTNIDNGFGNQLAELIECCSGTGTLGCFAQDKDGNPVLLSCHHVLFSDDHAPDAGRVFQPRYSCCCGGDEIAKQVIADPSQLKNGLYSGGYSSPPADATVKVIYHGVITDPWNVPNGFTPTVTDCAMATLTKKAMKYRNVWKYSVGGQAKEVELKGFYDPTPDDPVGVKKGPALGTLPTTDQYIRTYSERLGRMVYGSVLGLPGSSAGPPPPDDPQRLLYPNGVGDPTTGHPICRQLMFLPRPDPDPTKTTVADAYAGFSGLGPDHGDSGTMVINSDNMIVGMIVALLKPNEIFTADTVSGNVELSSISGISMFTPISNIVALLGVKMPASPSPFAGTVPSKGARVFVPGSRDLDESARQRGLARLREGLRTSRRGRLVLGKIAQHGRELRLMFHRVRALASAWQHFRGPGFLHHGIRSVQQPGHPIPHRIDGVTRRELADALLPIVERHASLPLRRDLAKYGAWAIEKLIALDAIDDAIDAVAT